MLHVWEKREVLMGFLWRHLKERHGHRWEDIKMVLQEAGCKLMDWIHLAQNRDKLQALTSTVMNLWIS
jgi:hypothetical protein